jgi:ribonuclease HI
LADFVAEWIEIQDPPPDTRSEHWIMYFDAALNRDGAGDGVLFISPKGEQLKYILHLLFKATNNAAEYEALIQASGSLSHSASSICRLMVTPKSTKTGSAPRRRWMPTAER